MQQEFFMCTSYFVHISCVVFFIFVISAEVTEFSWGGLVIKLHVSKYKQYGGMVCSLRFNFISKQYYALLHRIIADYGLSTEHETRYYRNRRNKQINDFPCPTHIIFVKKRAIKH